MLLFFFALSYFHHLLQFRNLRQKPYKRRKKQNLFILIWNPFLLGDTVQPYSIEDKKSVWARGLLSFGHCSLLQKWRLMSINCWIRALGHMCLKYDPCGCLKSDPKLYCTHTITPIIFNIALEEVIVCTMLCNERQKVFCTVCSRRKTLE